MSPSWANHLSPDWHPPWDWPVVSATLLGGTGRGDGGVSCLGPHFEGISMPRSQTQTPLALPVLLAASPVSVLLGMPVGVLPRDKDSGLPRAWQWPLLG